MLLVKLHHSFCDQTHNESGDALTIEHLFTKDCRESPITIFNKYLSYQITHEEQLTYLASSPLQYKVERPR